MPALGGKGTHVFTLHWHNCVGDWIECICSVCHICSFSHVVYDWTRCGISPGVNRVIEYSQNDSHFTGATWKTRPGASLSGFYKLNQVNLNTHFKPHGIFYLYTHTHTHTHTHTQVNTDMTDIDSNTHTYHCMHSTDAQPEWREACGLFTNRVFRVAH